MNGLKPVLTSVGERLVESGVKEGEGSIVEDSQEALKAGGESSVELEGPAAVRELTLRLEADDLEQALRSTVLEIAFDGRTTVWCPVGELAGIGQQVRAYQTWYTRVTDDGTMSVFWTMPFEKSCRLVIHNLGQQDVRIATGQVRLGAWDWDDRSLHFHAAWRQYSKIDTGPNKNQTGDGAFDVNYVVVTGRGQYVGDTLTVFNGVSAWWGEGDEKIYIDGESFPSHVGTGTEDYYGYAWCRPEFFEAPFHAQPTGTGNLAGGFSVNSRYRSLDALPFSESIKVDMELWHWRSTRMNYAPATFWYARPGASWNIEPDPRTAAEPIARKRSDVVEVLHVPGAIEGETLKIVEATGGASEIQDGDRFRWSGDQQLWWRDGKPGDRLVLEFLVKEAGTYRVQANLTKAVDYGIVQLTINGQPAAETFDRYARAVAHDLLDVGRFELKKGPNLLVVEITGAHPKAVKKHMFGLDYLKLEKVR